MIVPMLKYTFIAYHEEYDKFLNDIRDIGVLDIVEKVGDTEKVSKEKLDHFKNISKVYNFLVKQKDIALEEIKTLETDLKKRNVDTEYQNISQKDWTDIYTETLSPGKQRKAKVTFRYYRDKFANKDLQKPELSYEEIFTRVLKLRDQKDALIQNELILNKALKAAEPWGEYSHEIIKKLKENNIDIRLYVVSEKKFDPKWNDLYDIVIISTISPFTYFAVVTEPDKKIEIDAELVALPRETTHQIEKRKTEQYEEIIRIEQELHYLALNYTEDIRRYLLELEQDIDFSNVLGNTQNAVEDQVRIIEAYVPKDEADRLNDYLKNESIVYFTEKPDPNDRIPIKQKNNRFAKLFEPIGELFSLPSYQELDLTPFFAPFFMMFFGFCLGDVGYGLVILLGTTFYKIKAKPEVKPVLSLAQFLGIGTIIFGTLTGTFFGIELMKVESLERFTGFMLDSQKTFYLALGIGLFQILFGLIIKAANSIRMFGWQYAVSSIGWFILILALLDIALLKLLPFSKYIAWLAVALIVFWSDPKAGIFGRIGKGIWDLYGITGIFGDVLSYIRLFALGISSAILGFVINTIALQILGSAPIIGHIFFVVFLLIGHTANLLISSLGSFVHPMRLTFVEFYKNAGFIGGGKEYKPFKNKLIIKKENNL
jgi:V/A-type H+-transporting ATPase subunit I